MLTRDLLAFVRSALPEPPARVLEVGAGRGELAGALVAAGYQVTAVDPAAEPGSQVRRCSLLDVTGSFDASVAVVALHHVDPLGESCAHLAGLLNHGGVLVIDELDSGRFDERAANWWLGQRWALGYEEKERDPGGMVRDLRDHVHSPQALDAALRPFFEFGLPVRGAYLHRWELGAGLREPEVDLIAEGGLPAVGYRLIARRRNETDVG